jgi:DNA polymerase-3 subunit delta'
MDWGILGHEWAVDLLSEHVAGGEARHAYLFCGPEGVGRRTLALRFAQAINCPSPPAPGIPCRACRTCLRIERQEHPDLDLVQASGEGKEIKISQVRELQHHLALLPYEARYRIALLANFQDASLSAQNALLKTLEEAPAKVILLLTADAPESLLPTIVSRCEVLRLRPLAVDQAALSLVRPGLDAAQARLLAHLSGGRVGYALRLKANPAELEKRKALLDALRDLLASSRRARFAYVASNTRDKDLGRMREFLRLALAVWLSYWRDLMLLIARSDSPLVNLDREAELRQLAGELDLPAVRRAAMAIEEALRQLDANVNPRLLAEVLLLDWPRLVNPHPHA